MGTRADFYIKSTEETKPIWLGSIAWDGNVTGIDTAVLEATNPIEFADALKTFFEDRNDVTLPDRGWPWPWKDSRTTDYAYILMPNGKVMASCFGSPLFDPLTSDGDDEEETDERLQNFFPDMTAVKNVRHDEGSGIIIIQSRRDNQN